MSDVGGPQKTDKLVFSVNAADFFHLSRVRRWKMRAEKIVCDALEFENADTAGWEKAWDIAEFYAEIGKNSLSSRWSLVERQVLDGRPKKYVPTAVANVVAACMLITCLPPLVMARERGDWAEVYHILYMVERYAHVMNITSRELERGRHAAKAKASADDRVSRAIMIYMKSPEKWRSSAKAAEEIAPRVNLAVEVLVKHLRKYKNSVKADHAMQSLDSAEHGALTEF